MAKVRLPDPNDPNDRIQVGSLWLNDEELTDIARKILANYEAEHGEGSLLDCRNPQHGFHASDGQGPYPGCTECSH